MPVLPHVKLLTILWFLLIFCQPALAALSTINVGVYQNPPKIRRENSGRATGFWPELVEAIAAEEGWKINYIWGTWDDNLSHLDQGLIDILPDVAVTDSRKMRFNFSDQTVLLSWSGLYIGKDSPSLDSILDLNKRTIAVLRGSINYTGPEGIKSIAEKFNISSKFLEYSSYDEAFHAVQKGLADAAVTNNFYGEKNKARYAIKSTSLIFQPTSLNFAFTKQDPGRASELMTRIDHHLLAYKNDPDSIYYELLNKYFEETIDKDHFHLPTSVVNLLAALTFAIIITILAIAIYRRQLHEAKHKIMRNHARLQDQEKKYRNLLNSQQDAVLLRPFSRDKPTQFTEVNDSAVKLYGYSRKQLLQMTPADLAVISIGGQNSEEPNFPFPTEGVAQTFETLNCKKNGTLFPVEISSTVVTFNGQAYILSTVRDITLRKQTEQARQEYFHMLQTIAEQLPGVIYKITMSKNGRFSFPYISHVVDDMFNISARDIQKNSAVLVQQIHPDDMPLIYKTLSHSARDLSPWSEKFRIVDQNKGVRWMFSNCTPYREQEEICWYGFSTDITDQIEAAEKQEELERQLQQKHKMEAVGVLAGGIAHNFNNNLSIILGNLELAQRRISNTAKCKEHIALAQTALFRSRDLIKQLMIYSRNDIQQFENIPLIDIISETVSLLRSTIPSSVHIEQEIEPQLTHTIMHADGGQIQETLINLCNNAVYAMNDKGAISITLTRAQPHELAGFPEARAQQQYICLSVQDTGCGIPADMIDKIFDPFFTTKGVGQGTGMGLATVRGIINSHQGFIRVDSKVNEGTAIRLFLPATTMKEKQEDSSIENLHKGATERVLFVDDDQMLVQTGGEVLRELGYQVSAYADPREALEDFKKNPDKYDLLVTDQIMPDLTGQELIQQIKQLRPDLPTILCTGFSQKINRHNAKQTGADAFCTKPLKMAEMAQAIRTCLFREDEQIEKSNSASG